MHCAVGNCRATTNRRAVQDADAVIFHLFRTDWRRGDDPTNRSAAQYYVANIGEPASYPWTRHRLQQLRPGFFNLSMTYRLDSDVPLPNIMSRVIPPGHRKTTAEIRARVQSHPKRKVAAWFVSHCKTLGQREVYVQELQKYIPVDIYGACGPLNCSFKAQRAKFCYEMLASDYFFYLSFENALCVDYVTEKLGNVLEYDVLPVTYGGANNSRIVPPYSHVNALDFESPKQLAGYLKYLMENRTAYLEYFDWKVQYKTLSIGTTMAQAYCQLCAVVNSPERKPSSHLDFASWWSGPGVCRPGNFSFSH